VLRTSLSWFGGLYRFIQIFYEEFLMNEKSVLKEISCKKYFDVSDEFK